MFAMTYLRRSLSRSCIFVVVVLSIGQAASAAAPVSYEEHVRPILKQYCFKCHGEDQQKADLNLATYGTVLKGGSAGKSVVSGRASASVLFQAIINEDAEARMPPNSPPLSADKIEIIRTWIQEGLRETAGSKVAANARDIGFKPTAHAGVQTEGPPPMPEKLPALELSVTKRASPVLSLVASPSAPLLAVSSYESIRLIDLKTQEPIGALPFHEGEPHVLRFSRDGKVLMAAGGKPVQSGKVVLFDVRRGQRLTSVGDEIDAVLAADLSPDQTLVALGGSNRVVKVFNTEDGSLKYKIAKHTDWITALAFSPDGKQLATADRAGGMHLWDAKSGAILLTLAEHKASIRTINWRSDSRLLASGGEDGLLVWWDAADGWPAISKNNAHLPARPQGIYGKLPSGVLAATFGSKGQLLTAGRDRVARLWDPSGAQLARFPIADALPTQVAISSDNATLVVGDASGKVQFFRAP